MDVRHARRLKAYAQLAHVPETAALAVRDTFYPHDNMLVDHVSGLAPSWRTGSRSNIWRHRSQAQLGQLFQIPPPLD